MESLPDARIAAAMCVSASTQAQVRDIFVFKAQGPNALGQTQAQINADLKPLRTSRKLDTLRASILSDRLSIGASKSAGAVKFEAYVVGSTSADLNQVIEVIEVSVGEIAIDLPGPDVIVGLFVSKSDIEAQMRSGMSSQAALNKPLRDAKTAMFQNSPLGLRPQHVSMSVWRTRVPQTSTLIIQLPSVPDVHVPTFSVLIDPAFGMPLKLYRFGPGVAMPADAPRVCVHERRACWSLCDSAGRCLGAQPAQHGGIGLGYAKLNVGLRCGHAGRRQARRAGVQAHAKRKDQAGRFAFIAPLVEQNLRGQADRHQRRPRPGGRLHLAGVRRGQVIGQVTVDQRAYRCRQHRQVAGFMEHIARPGVRCAVQHQSAILDSDAGQKSRFGELLLAHANANVEQEADDPILRVGC